MRKGVLYFIRDPDDPTFHPVRDVLERNVTTQLRKIAFSALVYGALVIVCLGGVVWGLNHCSRGILPIHWTNKTPSLEFPIDLLFYNFLTPLVIKVYKPSDGLYNLYEWWFRRCGRFLRLSSFLFGEQVSEEEGRHVRPTWKSWFAGEKGDPIKPVKPADQKKMAAKPQTEAYFVFDGKYVRAPASDQLRIPKGEAVFIEVDELDNRKDGKPESSGVHARGSSMITVVYIPPWFRIRIAVFVLTIWMFAAVTGVGVTIGPLLFGRYMFSVILPPDIVLNDIHAFSLGIYTLGGLAYGAYQLYKVLSAVRQSNGSPFHAIQAAWAATFAMATRVLRVVYVYSSLVIVIPILFALLLELYILIPLHAYFGSQEPHVVHLVQDWTLGFLYARLTLRVVFSNRTSRPARAFAAVIADGYSNPNARLATRCFLLPVVFCSAVAILVPTGLAWTLNRTLWIGATEVFKSQVWRFSYPTVAMFTLSLWAAKEGASMLNRWRMVVRDEVYLIGERLHNFGEKRPHSGVARVGEAV
jgi:E3 ubiquitin-protein ligase MARCH6